MSLLMDALRKAEEAKRAQSENAEAPELALEPMHDRAQAKPGAATAKSDASDQRSAVQNAFAAKAPAGKDGDRLFILSLAGIVGLVLIGGAYLWWQTQPRSLAAPDGLRLPPAQSRPALSLAAPPSTEPDAPPRPNIAESVALEKAGWRTDRTQAAEPQPAGPIHISRNRPHTNPLLEQGYAALQHGNLVQAQQAYERMLSSDPNSVDALYGLAAIAVHRQQAGLAADYYLRILEADPRDAYAHAGLAGLNGRGDNAESRLKTLIAEQPGVAQLHFALGNLYAGEQRWRDAQQAYFLAYKNDSDSPDIVFNLAVSLDQLRQDKLAAQYYAEALRAAAVRPATFGREATQMRLRELQGAAVP